ncbi:RNA processing protein [Serendipita sp. 398]|nr:RNA processing protein [Serendipita sp. 398]
MLPLTLLKAAQGKPMMVELKNGESFNGHLIDCDTFMNITLREVYQTAADSERFWKLKEVYIRGSTIKYLQVQPALLDSVKEEQQKTREAMRNNASGQRGGRGANRGGGMYHAPHGC